MEETRFFLVSAVPQTAQGFSGATNFAGLQFERLHHLADEAIRQDDGGIAIAIGQIKGQHREVRHLLHGSGSYDDISVIAMAAAFDDREIVALFRRDIAESRAAADHINNDTRNSAPAR